jgi:excisionase family DNA binding protein
MEMKANLQERDLMEAIEIFEPLLTAEEAAAHLLIHSKTLMRMARQFQVPAIRIGKYWRFRLSALDEWVAGNENHSSQPFA